MKLSIGAKIGGGFLVILLLLAIISLNGVNTLSELDNDVEDINTRFSRISLDYQIMNEFGQVSTSVLRYMSYGGDQYLEEYNAHLDNTRNLVQARLKNCSATAKADYDTVLLMIDNYNDRITNELVPLVKQGKMEYAKGVGKSAAPILDGIESTIKNQIIKNEQQSKSLLATAQNDSRNSITIVITISVLALVIGVVIAFFITKSFTASIKVIKENIQRFANGDFTKEVTIKSKDEIGELAKAINNTQSTLKELIAEVSMNAQSIAAHSQQLAASAEEVSSTVEEVSSTTNEVASMAEKSLDTTEVATQQSEKVVEVASSGGLTVERTIEKINAISQSTVKVNTSVQNLGEQSKKVGQITDVITGIADQTNLLALNAAIEAARAGEMGRGFAVVAEEVRKLAEQSSTAAKEIGQLVTQIQAGVQATITSMLSGSAEVKEGVQLASEAGAALNDIKQSINKNIELMSEINQSTKQTNEGTQQLSASNEQVAASIQQVATATQELANIANKLQSSIERFKL